MNLNKGVNMKADNIKNGKRIVITHGELCIVPISKKPSGESQEVKAYIAGHSESGHHHMLTADTEFEVFEGNERVVVIKELAKLWHKKSFDIHETRVLAPGIYRIIEKTEYNPFTKAIQRVFD